MYMSYVPKYITNVRSWYIYTCIRIYSNPMKVFDNVVDAFLKINKLIRALLRQNYSYTIYWTISNFIIAKDICIVFVKTGELPLLGHQDHSKPMFNHCTIGSLVISPLSIQIVPIGCSLEIHWRHWICASLFITEWICFPLILPLLVLSSLW
jgi:hypothetical protein